ncbi:MAG: hypothetical protein LQ342_001925 [Letrouitia transgressa]|nr:MAG: hypothetical protein LQ342_001925 [Letrouitia transgressa]
MGNYTWCDGPKDRTSVKYKENIAACVHIIVLSFGIIAWYAAASVEAYKAYKKAHEAQGGQPTQGAQGTQGAQPTHGSQRTQGAQPTQGAQGTQGAQQAQGTEPTHEAQPTHDPPEQILKANLLSGLLASMVTISLTWGDYPQAIEATFSLVLALSQASALGWFDFRPDAKKKLIVSTKVPDVLAVSLSLWALRRAQTAYIDAPPSRAKPWTPFAVCSITNVVVMAFLYSVWLYKGRSSRRGSKSFSGPIAQFRELQNNAAVGNLPTKDLSIITWFCCGVFICSNCGGAVGWWFAKWGCWPFNFALSIAPVSVIAGNIYSFFQIKRKLRDFKNYCQDLQNQQNNPQKQQNGHV